MGGEAPLSAAAAAAAGSTSSRRRRHSRLQWVRRSTVAWVPLPLGTCTTCTRTCSGRGCGLLRLRWWLRSRLWLWPHRRVVLCGLSLRTGTDGVVLHTGSLCCSHRPLSPAPSVRVRKLNRHNTTPGCGQSHSRHRNRHGNRIAAAAAAGTGAGACGAGPQARGPRRRWIAAPASPAAASAAAANAAACGSSRSQLPQQRPPTGPPRHPCCVRAAMGKAGRPPRTRPWPGRAGHPGQQRRVSVVPPAAPPSREPSSAGYAADRSSAQSAQSDWSDLFSPKQ